MGIGGMIAVAMNTSAVNDARSAISFDCMTVSRKRVLKNYGKLRNNEY
jgi:hypothetical protein